jgi:single-strand selective monofunctional uracil DNA glycosylase
VPNRQEYPVIEALLQSLDGLRFEPPVAFVYQPFHYARPMIERYLERFSQGTKEVFFLGMNPGPWGMGQTGIPFGAVTAVRRFLVLDEPIEAPAQQHSQRPIQGLQCRREEVSGTRFWSWAERRFGSAEAFFQSHFVWNYCPLLFLDERGRNVPLDKLTRSEQAAIIGPCDIALQSLLAMQQPRTVVGLGHYASRCLKRCAGDALVLRAQHPSPANPSANHGWEEHLDALLLSAARDID